MVRILVYHGKQKRFISFVKKKTKIILNVYCLLYINIEKIHEVLSYKIQHIFFKFKTLKNKKNCQKLSYRLFHLHSSSGGSYSNRICLLQEVPRGLNLGMAVTEIYASLFRFNLILNE